ncbi:MAG: glutamate racemase [Candidatus Kerfeldbacteria bacterium]|nr:glutamate racemase [Candidatus Kerfeldbacteria bacterium]
MVALFDSGVGGLSVWQEIRRFLPNEPMVYLADTAHVPYGKREEAEIRRLSSQAIKLLLCYQPDLIVVACNTASTIALAHLRQVNPDIPFVGIVPALKPAAALTKTGWIAVLATAATLKSDGYQKLKQSFARSVTVVDQRCPEWVMLVEKGSVDNAAAEAAVRHVIDPLRREGVDTHVLGSTHFVFLRRLIETAAGPGATLLDSGAAVAQQVGRLLKTGQPTSPGPVEHFLCTGDPQLFSAVASRLLERPVLAEQVEFTSD